MPNDIFDKVDNKKELSKADIKYLLEIENKDELQQLFNKAYDIKSTNIGKKVWFRGIIEFSNICRKDCYYCGIRKSNKTVERFMMKEEEILEGAEWAYKQNYGSVVLQSGERDDPYFVDFITSVLEKIKKLSNGELGITISLGEQSKKTYRRWFNAGAHRYLLRVETTNTELYKKLHPEDHSLENRIACLRSLKEVGYQLGTGVMIGLPMQTIDDLVNDILFFKEIDADMIGMGPYIVSENTPTAEYIDDYTAIKENQYKLALKMIAATRIYLRDVNIASTTALQALKTYGREMGLKAGANIIMPNVTDTKYRSNYQLYEDKPCVDESSDLCMGCLEGRILKIDETVGLGEWGDSPHFKKKTGKIGN